MKRVELKVGWYVKFILTVIAISLLGSLLKPVIFPKKVIAWQDNILDVNVEKIGGRYIEYAEPLPVKIVK